MVFLAACVHVACVLQAHQRYFDEDAACIYDREYIKRRTDSGASSRAYYTSFSHSSWKSVAAVGLSLGSSFIIFRRKVLSGMGAFSRLVRIDAIQGKGFFV